MKINYFDNIDLEKLYPEYGRYILSSQDPNDYMGFGYWFNQGSTLCGGKPVNYYVRGNIDNIGFNSVSQTIYYPNDFNDSITVLDTVNKALCKELISSVSTTETGFEVSYNSTTSTLTISKSYPDMGEYNIPITLNIRNGKEKIVNFSLKVLQRTGGGGGG